VVTSCSVTVPVFVATTVYDTALPSVSARVVTVSSGRLLTAVDAVTGADATAPDGAVPCAVTESATGAFPSTSACVTT
jgi:hypothetical protein